MTEFYFDPLLRDRLVAMFDGRRPPNRDRAEFFVNTCEREIVSWLRAWPADSWKPKEATGEAIERVRTKAFELLLAIEALDTAAAWMLLPLRYADDEHPSRPGENIEEKRAIKVAVQRMRIEADTIERLYQAAGNAHAWYDCPITRRSDQDLCDRFATAYIAAFHELPAYGPGSIFPAFCNEVENAISDYPGAVPVRITRTIIERARERTAIQLDDFS
ncbi:MAG: hypothetical protein C0607_10535 [Azoarcus sp.]|nr:MAG: hypothetical protein C0607_10535 [Azoarcus sp.]